MQIHLRLPNQYPGRFTGNDRRHGGVVSSGAGYRQYTHSGGASFFDALLSTAAGSAMVTGQ